WNTLNQGQVNLALWALLALDLRRIVATGRGGWGTGLASAVKLTPALVGVLLVAAGRVRAAVVAGLVALWATALAWIAAPDDSVIYWTELVFDSGRVGSVGDGRNNALAALPHRVGAGSSTLAT